MSRTLLDIRTQIKDDLDLNEETFVTDIDLNRWINDAIETAEAEIHDLYEDYFVSDVDVPISVGVNKYDYPADIYANKIRKILYKEASAVNGSSAHEVLREKDLIRAESRDIYETNSTNPSLSWTPSNNAAEGKKIRLHPSSGRDGILTIHYIRNAKKLSLDTDICDIDEFERFVVQAVKTQVFIKDGDPRTEESKGLEEQLKVAMVLTLSNMTPDNNDDIEFDLSHYSDMVGGQGNYGDYE